MTDWLKAGNNAVITGGASGIGLATARYYLSKGMNVLIADLAEEALATVSDSLSMSVAVQCALRSVTFPISSRSEPCR